MLNRLNKLMEEHEKEQERIQNAYEKDKELIMSELSQWMQLLSVENVDKDKVQKKINELTKKLIDIDKVRRLNNTNTNGIINAAKTLNRMLGFDITKVEINTQDTEREEMEKLTVGELKELINISKKGD